MFWFRLLASCSVLKSAWAKLKFFANSLYLFFILRFLAVLCPSAPPTRIVLYMAAKSTPGALPSPISLFLPFVEFISKAATDFLSVFPESFELYFVTILKFG